MPLQDPHVCFEADGLSGEPDGSVWVAFGGGLRWTGGISSRAGAGHGGRRGSRVLNLKTAPTPQLDSAVVEASEVPLVMAPIGVGAAELAQHKGHRLLLKGWLRPAPMGPGHFYVFTKDENGPIDRRHIRVFPTDTRKMSTGHVQLEGHYFEGDFFDEPTDTAAPAVLTEAI